MNFATWLRSRLARYPLKEPPVFDRARYTAEVMERVKALREPGPVLRPAGPWPAWGPRLALAAAAVAVAFVVVGRVRSPGPGRLLAEQVADDAQLLAALDEPLPPAGVAPDDAEGLADELEAVDALLLAEAPPSDDEWIEQTLTLLEQLEEDLPEGASDEPSGDEWLDELQWLDDRDLAAPS